MAEKVGKSNHHRNEKRRKSTNNIPLTRKKCHMSLAPICPPSPSSSSGSADGNVGDDFQRLLNPGKEEVMTRTSRQPLHPTLDEEEERMAEEVEGALNPLPPPRHKADSDGRREGERRSTTPPSITTRAAAAKEEEQSLTATSLPLVSHPPSFRLKTFFSAVHKWCTCAVCYRVFSHPFVLPCSHIFCRSCIVKNLEAQNRRCPLCNHDLRSLRQCSPLPQFQLFITSAKQLLKRVIDEAQKSENEVEVKTEENLIAENSKTNIDDGKKTPPPPRPSFFTSLRNIEEKGSDEKKNQDEKKRNAKELDRIGKGTRILPPSISPPPSFPFPPSCLESFTCMDELKKEEKHEENEQHSNVMECKKKQTRQKEGKEAEATAAEEVSIPVEEQRKWFLVDNRGPHYSGEEKEEDPLMIIRSGTSTPQVLRISPSWRCSAFSHTESPMRSKSLTPSPPPPPPPSSLSSSFILASEMRTDPMVIIRSSSSFTPTRPPYPSTEKRKKRPRGKEEEIKDVENGVTRRTTSARGEETPCGVSTTKMTITCRDIRSDHLHEDYNDDDTDDDDHEMYAYPAGEEQVLESRLRVSQKEEKRTFHCDNLQKVPHDFQEINEEEVQEAEGWNVGRGGRNSKMGTYWCVHATTITTSNPGGGIKEATVRDVPLSSWISPQQTHPTLLWAELIPPRFFSSRTSTAPSSSSFLLSLPPWWERWVSGECILCGLSLCDRHRVQQYLASLASPARRRWTRCARKMVEELNMIKMTSFLGALWGISLGRHRRGSSTSRAGSGLGWQSAKGKEENKVHTSPTFPPPPPLYEQEQEALVMVPAHQNCLVWAGWLHHSFLLNDDEATTMREGDDDDNTKESEEEDKEDERNTALLSCVPSSLRVALQRLEKQVLPTRRDDDLSSSFCSSLSSSLSPSPCGFVCERVQWEEAEEGEARCTIGGERPPARTCSTSGNHHRHPSPPLPTSEHHHQQIEGQETKDKNPNKPSYSTLLLLPSPDVEGTPHHPRHQPQVTQRRRTSYNSTSGCSICLRADKERTSSSSSFSNPVRTGEKSTAAGFLSSVSHEEKDSAGGTKGRKLYYIPLPTTPLLSYYYYDRTDGDGKREEVMAAVNDETVKISSSSSSSASTTTATITNTPIIARRRMVEERIRQLAHEVWEHYDEEEQRDTNIAASPPRPSTTASTSPAVEQLLLRRRQHPERHLQKEEGEKEGGKWKRKGGGRGGGHPSCFLCGRGSYTRTSCHACSPPTLYHRNRNNATFTTTTTKIIARGATPSSTPPSCRSNNPPRDDHTATTSSNIARWETRTVAQQHLTPFLSSAGLRYCTSTSTSLGGGGCRRCYHFPCAWLAGEKACVIDGVEDANRSWWSHHRKDVQYHLHSAPPCGAKNRPSGDDEEHAEEKRDCPDMNTKEERNKKDILRSERRSHNENRAHMEEETWGGGERKHKTQCVENTRVFSSEMLPPVCTRKINLFQLEQDPIEVWCDRCRR